jgi:Flp pilus assembly pilin Flp
LFGAYGLIAERTSAAIMAVVDGIGTKLSGPFSTISSKFG